MGVFDSQRNAARRVFSGGRMFSSGFEPPSELSGKLWGCGVWPAGASPTERVDASSEAEDSGTGELGGALAAAS